MEGTARTSGLTSAEAARLERKYGYNEIPELMTVSPLDIFLRQIKGNFLLYLLIGAAILAFFAGDHIAVYTILAIVVVVIGTGFAQEYKAEQAIKFLKGMVIPVSTVIRDGKRRVIQSRNLVPGDVVLLVAGEKIPADCLVLDENELHIDESILTGESKGVEKIVARDLKHYKDENALFMGSLILNGSCTGLVIHTGMNTEFGKIARMISTAEKELPLRAKINKLAKFMIIVAIVFSVLVGLLITIRSYPMSEDSFLEMIVVVIALAVAAFPEGIPVVLTTTLAAGAYQMAKKNAIVNRMSIIETLGETTVICADKTGTLTKGEMTVKKVFYDKKLIDVGGVGYEATGGFLVGKKRIDPRKDKTLSLLLRTSVLCNDAIIEKTGRDEEYNTTGTPTEAALLIMSAKAGVFREDIGGERLAEIPFSSERKSMFVIYPEKNRRTVYGKGAPEVVLTKCEFIMNAGGVKRLTPTVKRRILGVNKRLGRKGYRTLAIVYKSNTGKDDTERGLVFLGLVAMEDPPRQEVADAIAKCGIAGIKVKMITGDNKETAVTIAKRIGIRGEVTDGAELEEMTDEELSDKINNIGVFSRVKPEQKLRIVKALKSAGEVATMTGDGINDAPALKGAHIGVAMGRRGTDVAREASDLILKDDNFSTIVYAISEGRSIFENVRKFITYQLSCNYAELLIIFLAIMIGFPLPLLALQILFMNLVTDDLPAITLGFTRNSESAMLAKPRKNSSIMNKELLVYLLVAGSVMIAGTLGMFAYALYFMHAGIAASRTVALVTLIILEISNAFNFRSFKKLVYRSSIRDNKYLVYASIVSLLATIMIVYSPLNVAFSTVPISIYYWIAAVALAALIVVSVDILKKLLRNRIADRYL